MPLCCNWRLLGDLAGIFKSFQSLSNKSSAVQSTFGGMANQHLRFSISNTNLMLKLHVKKLDKKWEIKNIYLNTLVTMSPLSRDL